MVGLTSAKRVSEVLLRVYLPHTAWHRCPKESSFLKSRFLAYGAYLSVKRGSTGLSNELKQRCGKGFRCTHKCDSNLTPCQPVIGCIFRYTTVFLVEESQLCPCKLVWQMHSNIERVLQARPVGHRYAYQWGTGMHTKSFPFSCKSNVTQQVWIGLKVQITLNCRSRSFSSAHSEIIKITQHVHESLWTDLKTDVTLAFSYSYKSL